MCFCMHFSQFACHVLSKIYLYDQKHTLFSNFARFCTPKRCTRVQCLVLKNNPNYVNFWTSLIPSLTIQVAPPGQRPPTAHLNFLREVLFVPQQTFLKDKACIPNTPFSYACG